MAEYDETFTFRIPADLKRAVEFVASAEDRSRSKVIVYLMWAGLEGFLKHARLITPLDVQQLSDRFKEILEEDKPKNESSESETSSLSSQRIVDLEVPGIPNHTEEGEQEKPKTIRASRKAKR